MVFDYTIIENKKKKSLEYNFTQKLHIQKMVEKYLKIFYSTFVELNETGGSYQKNKEFLKKLRRKLKKIK